MKFTKDGQGILYLDPKYKGTYMKIQKAQPSSSNPGQRHDNVRVQKNGQSFDRFGNRVSKRAEASHIPLSVFDFIKDYFK